MPILLDLSRMTPWTNYATILLSPHRAILRIRAHRVSAGTELRRVNMNEENHEWAISIAETFASIRANQFLMNTIEHD